MSDYFNSSRNDVSNERPIKSLIYIFKALYRLVKKNDSYLLVTGWLRSLKHGYPCRPDGSPIPWMNYSIVAILEERLNKELNLFEYGSGYSTLFYAKHVKWVDSIEYNQEWYKRMSTLSPENCRIMFIDADENGQYCRSIIEHNRKYHVVIVDGRDRVNCIRQALGALTDDGVIILDDSARERYREGINCLNEAGFRSLKLEGMKPAKRTLNTTTIFYRPNNCLNI